MAFFGPHVTRAHAKAPRGQRPTITAHIEAARAQAKALDIDARAFQVFLAGPRGFTVVTSDEELDELRGYIAGRAAARDPVYVVAHGTYMDFPWSGKPYTAKFIRKELAMCARAGLAGLVIHLGKPDVATVARTLPRIMWQKPPDFGEGSRPLVYLEVPHLKPASSHYETPEKLATLFRAVRKADPGLRHFGLCIDTAHLWSCGVDLRTRADAEDWVERLEAVADVIPPGRILFHLNDSCNARGSGADKHAPLFGGNIWGDYKDRPQESGLAVFVEYALRHGTPTILEHKLPQLAGTYAALESLTDALAPGAFAEAAAPAQKT